MIIAIVRQASTIDGTPGTLTTDGGFTCQSLELPWKNNLNSVSCILPDTYDATLFDSPHFGHLVVRLSDKHNRSNVEIHNANFAGEAAGDVKQLDGCVAVGNGYGQLQNSLGNWQLAILSSVATLSNLVQHIISHVGENGAFQVVISWADGCAPTDASDLNNAV